MLFRSVEVFERCLENNRIEADQRPALHQAFAEITAALDLQDSEAENGP